MGNEHLRTRMRANGITLNDLASAVDVDPKTVERWIVRGRLPHQRHRSKAAALLGTPETQLWPQLLEGDPACRTAEVVAVYPDRGAVPPEVWLRLVDDATEHVDVLAYAALFLFDGHPDLPRKLTARASGGLQARLLLGKADSDAVSERGQEEGTGPNLAARVNLTFNYLQPALGVRGIDVRTHETVLYNSLYRFDDELLVNTHVHGSPAPQNPVLHLRCGEGGRLFEHYMSSFDRIWEAAGSLGSEG